MQKEGAPRKSRWWLWFAVMLPLLLLLLAAGILCYYWWQMKEPLPHSSTSTQQSTEVTSDSTPFNVLLLGVDRRKNETSRGRSDALHVARINPQKRSVSLLAIARDAFVEIPGYKPQKINHAYAFGGANLSKQTVEKFLGCPMDQYIEIDMEGFATVIDYLGGITVDSPLEFTYGGHTFQKGSNELNGEQALGFVRMRKEDPEGDVGRIRRGQLALQAIFAKVNSLPLYELIPFIYKAAYKASKYVKTDLSLGRMKQLADLFRQGPTEKLQTQILGGTPARIDGAAVQKIGEQELEKAKKLICSSS